MWLMHLFSSSVLWDRDCASVPLLLDPAEDERGGQEVGGKTHGCLFERSARGCGQPLQAAYRSDSLSMFSLSSSVVLLSPYKAKNRLLPVQCTWMHGREMCILKHLTWVDFRAKDEAWNYVRTSSLNLDSLSQKWLTIALLLSLYVGSVSQFACKTTAAVI